MTYITGWSLTLLLFFFLEYAVDSYPMKERSTLENYFKKLKNEYYKLNLCQIYIIVIDLIIECKITNL